MNRAVVPAPTAAPVVELPCVDERAHATAAEPPARARRDLTGFTEPFRQFPNDLRRFSSSDTFKVVGVGGVAALAATRVDGQTVLEAREHLQPAGRFSTGNVGGGFFVQTGAAVATLAIGKALGESRLAYLGSDLVRAQLVSQTLVQGLKFATGRSRPDGSNTQSFPSGHTASARRRRPCSSATSAGRPACRRMALRPTSRRRGCRPTSII